MTTWTAALISFHIGMFLIIALVAFAARKKMIAAHPVKGTFAQVTQALPRIVPSFAGWGMPIESFDLYASQLQKNLKYDNLRNLKIFFICNPVFSHQVISANYTLAGIMPCSWAVIELASGQVMIAKLNIPLMARIFSGKVKEIMGKVGQAEKEMLKKLSQEVG